MDRRSAPPSFIPFESSQTLKTDRKTALLRPVFLSVLQDIQLKPIKTIHMFPQPLQKRVFLRLLNRYQSRSIAIVRCHTAVGVIRLYLRRRLHGKWVSALNHYQYRKYSYLAKKLTAKLHVEHSTVVISASFGARWKLSFENIALDRRL